MVLINIAKKVKIYKTPTKLPHILFCFQNTLLEIVNIIILNTLDMFFSIYFETIL